MTVDSRIMQESAADENSPDARFDPQNDRQLAAAPVWANDSPQHTGASFSTEWISRARAIRIFQGKRNVNENPMGPRCSCTVGRNPDACPGAGQDV